MNTASPFNDRLLDRRNLLRLTGLGTVGLVLSACSTTSSKPGEEKGPGTVRVRVSAAGNVNPNEAGRASPIAVSVFVLSGIGAFQQADYFQLAENATTALGANLVGSDRVFLRPGETKEVTLSTAAEQSYVGVIAGFQNIDQASWRATTQVGHDDTVNVSVARSSISARKA
ncbi:type VI secretion system lipoprotein TssJ [Shinella oryzae]|uniref:type VI secretion system lipoprotein TssJ n=1 Tax=Shinella TaxID=323620 RepID=UPI001FF5C729|nr:type VI secretion system lipoprotein TssJ [Shinella oryzae]UPA26892.1 type VI secretion system lipoprotein TssJ [Shinella oryzae]